MHVLIFGLGLHGGGAAAAVYFASHGHEVRVTDLKGPDQLTDSLRLIEGYTVTYTLGRHLPEDITWADLIIKNPAVPAGHPLLADAHNVINDIGFFMANSSLPVIAVTGTKGKSTTTALVSHLLGGTGRRVAAGGNLGSSPFGFLDSIASYDCSVLELSSWQIHDLAEHPFRGFQDIIITPLYHDHLNRYDSFEDYIQDKFRIFTGSSLADHVILPVDDLLADQYLNSHEKWYYSRKEDLPEGASGVLLKDRSITVYREGKVDAQYLYQFDHAYLPAITYGIAAGISLERILISLSRFQGLAHRREVVLRKDGITWMNDSAATIPEAVGFSLGQLEGHVHLITGGTDKELEPAVLAGYLRCCSSVHLLAGSFTELLIPILEAAAIPYHGPFTSMDAAVRSAGSLAAADETVLLSPGAASFGLFLHEFDRGDRFREAVLCFCDQPRALER